MSSFLHHLKTFLIYNESSPLIFTEGSFWLFFAVLLLGYSLVYKTSHLRSLYLLIFSFFFYYKSSGFFFFLLVFSTVCDYVLGLLISKTEISLK